MNKGKAIDARIGQNDIGRLYDRLAGVYDVWAFLTETKARNRAIELAGITDGQAVLEVAVGTGVAFAEIVKRNPQGRNIGIDLSEKMLERTQKRLATSPHHNYSLSIGTAFDIDVDSASIDVLINNYMFDLIAYEDMNDILAEFRRVLKPGGRLVLVTMTDGERFGSNIYNSLYKWSPQLMGGCRGVNLSERLSQQGFSVKSREYYQQFLFPSEVILASR